MNIIVGLLAAFGVLTISTHVYADSKNVVVIDVRTSDEFQGAHLKGAINIDLLSSDFKSKIDKLDKNKNYKVYCRSGNRSGQAEKIMKSLGFKDVENVGSVGQASKILSRECEGETTC